MDIENNPLFSLIRSYMMSMPAAMIMESGGEAAPNGAFALQMPGWDGKSPSFSWKGEPLPDTGCALGCMTAGWTDWDGRRRLLVADGCRACITLPDGTPVRLASFGGDSYQALLCVVSTFCAHILFTRPELADWAQKALDGIPLGVGIKDGELCYIGGNAAFSTLAGDDDYRGKTDFDLSWRERASIIRSNNAKTLVTGSPEMGRCFTARGGDGSMTRLRTDSMAAVTPAGRFIALVTLVEDITNRMDSGDAPFYSELQNKRVQQDIVNQSRSVALIISKTADANIRFITDSVRQYGYDADELSSAGASFSSLVCADARPDFIRFVEDTAAPGGEYTHTVPLSDACGGRHIVQMHLRCVLRDEGPSLEGMMVDISLRAGLQKRLMEESRSIQERISRVLGRDPELSGSDMAIEKLVNVERLQRHQDTLAHIFEVSAEAMDIHGTRLTAQSFPNPLMDFIMKLPAAAGLVRKELANLAEEAARTGAPVRGTCVSTGLHAAAVPFMRGGRNFATWIIGHVRLSPIDGEAFAESCREAGVNSKRALRLYMEQPEMGEEQFLEALSEFRLMADIVSMQCVRTEHLLSQAEAARQSTQEILHSLSQQRLINKCYNLTRTPGGLSPAIDGILACAGEDLGFSRAYLMEKRASGLLAITHEWREDNIPPIPWEYRVLIQNNGGAELYAAPGLKIVDARSSAESRRYAATGTKSSVHLPIFSEGALEGAVVFEECANNRTYFRRDREYLDVLMRLISSIVLRRNAEREIERSHAAIDTVMQGLDMAVFTYDPASFRVLYVNDYCVKSLSIDKLNPGCSWDIFPELIPDSCLRATAGKVSELSRGDRIFLVTMDRVPWHDGHPVQLVSAADITLNREREHLIEKLAYYDPLLNIPNRRKLEHDLEKALRKSNAEGSGGGLVFMDLDDFKLVNDSFGHNRGDMLLKTIAEFFQGFEPTRNRLYRLGGDEFMLILDGFDPERIADTVESVWCRFQQPWELDELSVFSTVSIGVSRFPEDGTTSGELLRYADVAMYKAKYEGKNSAVYFRKGLEAGVTQRMTVENRLRGAIKNSFEGFEVHYQPIIRLCDARVTGAEALLRWRDEEGRLLYPDSFLNIAESLGLMSALGVFVLRTALRDMRQYCSPEFLIAVNLSLRQFQSGSLPEELGEVLRETGVEPCNLVLGVGESAAAFDMQSGDNTLGRLRRLGAHISLDNKGASYNALSRIMRANIDFVNIDISLIGSMQHDEFSDTVVQASIELAKSAGCGVFCAGVEVQEQYLDLKDYGCDFAQGFFFSHAMPLEDFEAYMLRQRAESGKRRRVSRF